jgi:TonB family protein
MKMRKTLLISLVISLMCAPAPWRARTAAQSQQQPAAAQSSESQPSVEHFAKDGLSFDYPKGFKLTDRSSEAAQHLILGREGSSVLIMVIAHRDAVANREQFETARDQITTPYAQNLARSLGVEKAPSWEEAGCVDVGERPADGRRFATGFKLSGKSNGQPSTGEVYAAALGRRFVNLVYVRNDKDDAQGAPAWKTVLDTLKVEPPPGVTSGEAEGPLTVIVSGGVLNGKVTKKPPPEYPLNGRSAGASGTVVVQIVVDERGNVTSAHAVSGHSMLLAPSESAAMRAKFRPTTLCGRPVKASGVITYNYVLQ